MSTTEKNTISQPDPVKEFIERMNARSKNGVVKKSAEEMVRSFMARSTGWVPKGRRLPVEKFPEELQKHFPPNGCVSFGSLEVNGDKPSKDWFRKNKVKDMKGYIRGYYVKETTKNIILVLLASIDGKYRYIVVKNTTNLQNHGVKYEAKNGALGLLHEFESNIPFQVIPYITFGDGMWCKWSGEYYY